MVLLIHAKVGSSLQEDFRQLNFVFNAALMSQDIMSDQPSALPRRILIQFLLFGGNKDEIRRHNSSK